MVIHPVFFVVFGVFFVFCFILGLRLDAKVRAPRVSKLPSPVISEFDADRNRAFLGKHGEGREENTDFLFSGALEKQDDIIGAILKILKENSGDQRRF